MKHLEKQLESWIPRRPSARLKERIFAPQAQSDHTMAAEAGPVFSPWLKFAPACCILLLAFWLGMPRQDKTAYLAAAGGTYLVTAGGSNVLASLSSNLLALCATDLREQRENLWTRASFDWTKTAYSPSTTGSFPAWKTNVQKL